MTKALIADDEPHLAEYLRSRLAALWPELEIVGTAAHGAQALEIIDQSDPDLAFLDIKMPGLDGLEVAARLRGRRCRVVFVTAYDQFALDAFEQHAVDYLLKPVSDERLARAIDYLKQDFAAAAAAPQIDALLEQLARRSAQSAGRPPVLRWIRAQVGDVVHQIPVEDVVCFKAADKYTIVQLRESQGEGEILIRLSLSELLAQLDPELFWQVHRGTIVNLAHVVSARRDVLGKTLLRLRDYRAELVVSRQYAHRFRQM